MGFLRKLNLSRYSNGHILLALTAVLTVIAYGTFFTGETAERGVSPSSGLLTDPFLQLPTPNSVQVVWFTEFEGDRHIVRYGEGLETMAIATTTQLSRTREDQQSRVGEQTEGQQIYQQPVYRSIWRHEATVDNIQPNQRIPYRVTSENDEGEPLSSEEFTLAALPPPGTPVKILLTSDHQLMPMTPANLQKVVETVGSVDAVFLAGDLVNIPDRASEWFDDNRGGAFFPSLQGRAQAELERAEVTTTYRGGALIQSAPLFPALGNHEVMGRFSMTTGLGDQFNDPIPREVAKQLYAQSRDRPDAISNPAADAVWLKNHSYNTDTYQEIFSLPTTSPGGETYYAVSFGDVRLVALYATNIWRSPHLSPDRKGRFFEEQSDLTTPEQWGYGQHLFSPISPGSPQYTWLQQELRSPEFQQAKYKIVMLHHPPHSLGDNIVPAYTQPVQVINRDATGKPARVRYEYPLDQDYLIRDVMPLLESAGVQLVFYGHSHLWNRFISPQGMHFLESSNVGNTYNAYVGDRQRQVPTTGFSEKYVAVGDPNGLAPILPTLAPMLDEAGQPQPYIASNDITVFSILETATGTVSSYRFDTSQPNSKAIRFDEFQLGRSPQ